jgi:(p)ppGpp synthase/HD superfamily hydrolase
MRIAFDAHREQTDKSGLPYIFHPIHLAEGMETEAEICVALLHDVVEDTDTTLDDLRRVGFPPRIVDALSLLTHADGVDYMDYVARIRETPLAAKVKLADLRHNSDATRLPALDEKSPPAPEKIPPSD